MGLVLHRERVNLNAFSGAGKGCADSIEGVPAAEHVPVEVVVDLIVVMCSCLGCVGCVDTVAVRLCVGVHRCSDLRSSLRAVAGREGGEPERAFTKPSCWAKDYENASALGSLCGSNTFSRHRVGVGFKRKGSGCTRTSRKSKTVTK